MHQLSEYEEALRHVTRNEHKYKGNLPIARSVLLWMEGQGQFDGKWWTIVAKFPKPSGEGDSDTIEIVVECTGETYEQTIKSCPFQPYVIAAFCGAVSSVRGWTVADYRKQIQETEKYRSSEAQCYADPDNGKPVKKERTS